MAKKKARSLELLSKRGLIEPSFTDLSVRQQCDLIKLNRSQYYFQAATESKENLEIMRLIDEEYTRYPFYGSRKYIPYLKENGFIVNKKRVLRLMKIMDISPIYPKPNLSKASKGHKVYPYLLRNFSIEKPNQVWSTDITYMPIKDGFVYLTAVIDWYSRYVLAYELSNTLDTEFCIKALESALKINTPLIFNTDQGSQFTSLDFTNVLKNNSIKISMDGKGRAIDNVFIERLWRSVKYEMLYLKQPETVATLYEELREYFHFYNKKRYHQSLENRRPEEVYFSK